MVVVGIVATGVCPPMLSSNNRTKMSYKQMLEPLRLAEHNRNSLFVALCTQCSVLVQTKLGAKVNGEGERVD